MFIICRWYEHWDRYIFEKNLFHRIGVHAVGSWMFWFPCFWLTFVSYGAFSFWILCYLLLLFSSDKFECLLHFLKFCSWFRSWNILNPFENGFKEVWTITGKAMAISKFNNFNNDLTEVAITDFIHCNIVVEMSKLQNQIMLMNGRLSTASFN